MVVSAGHASATYLRRFVSAFGAGSVATTSNPRARYWAAQLAPMVGEIQVQIDGLGQAVVEHLDVGARGGALPFRKVRARPEDAAESRVVGALLCPVELPPPRIDAHADAPLGRVATVGVPAAGFDQRLELRAVEVGAHDAHALPVRPVELPIRPIELELLRRERAALRADRLPVPTVDVGTLDPPNVPAG